MKTTEEALSLVFGPESKGHDQKTRAHSSRVRFVRSQDHLAVATPESTGRILTAQEALDAYGFPKLLEAIEHGTAVLAQSTSEPAATLRKRRIGLGLSYQDIARATGLSPELVEGAENPARRSSIRPLERIATVLGLDERLLTIKSGAGGDPHLATRLKTLGQGPVPITPLVALTLSEAAWVIAVQDRLNKALGRTSTQRNAFKPSKDYGSAGDPTWRYGQNLAAGTRNILNLDPDAPIPSMRVVLDALRIPLVHASLPKPIAGATISSHGVRGIVVNTTGYNTNAWVRRATIAHELGHLLWDPEEHLESVRVDDYSQLENFSEVSPVEIRANAFAVYFLAPTVPVRALFNRHTDESEGLRAVMEHFGISFMSARFHVWNASYRTLDRESLVTSDWAPTAEWQAREGYTDDYFPISSTPQLRRGEFSGVVVAAERRGLISSDTAASYLQATPAEYAKATESIAELFPAA